MKVETVVSKYVILRDGERYPADVYVENLASLLETIKNRIYDFAREKGSGECPDTCNICLVASRAVLLEPEIAEKWGITFTEEVDYKEIVVDIGKFNAQWQDVVMGGLVKTLSRELAE